MTVSYNMVYTSKNTPFRTQESWNVMCCALQKKYGFTTYNLAKQCTNFLYLRDTLSNNVYAQFSSRKTTSIYNNTPDVNGSWNLQARVLQMQLGRILLVSSTRSVYCTWWINGFLYHHWSALLLAKHYRLIVDVHLY